ncbi:MAG: hypothetical protein MZV70_17400 [Desulfobacterales bacterium]|nr:hypothetical protein [Desulfobacterales bacterium]
MATPGTLAVQMDCDRPIEAKKLLEEFPGVIDAAVHDAQMHVSLESPDTRKNEAVLTLRLVFRLPKWKSSSLLWKMYLFTWLKNTAQTLADSMATGEH